MTPARWAQITDWFGDALEMRPDERAAYLWQEAEVHFSDARDIAEKTLAIAPSFNEIRKELAISYEGLADAAAAQQGANAPDVRRLLEKSATTWREVVAPQRGRTPPARSQNSYEKRLASLLH